MSSEAERIAAELEDQARYLESYPNAHILGLGPNHSRKPWSRWALDLTSLGGAAVLVALIFWAWLAWMEAHR
jgi:hypothetical protein